MEMDWKFWILTIAVLLGMIHVAFSELRESFADHDSEEEREKRENEREREREEDARQNRGGGSYYK